MLKLGPPTADKGIGTILTITIFKYFLDPPNWLALFSWVRPLGLGLVLGRCVLIFLLIFLLLPPLAPKSSLQHNSGHLTLLKFRLAIHKMVRGGWRVIDGYTFKDGTWERLFEEFFWSEGEWTALIRVELLLVFEQRVVFFLLGEPLKMLFLATV